MEVKEIKKMIEDGHSLELISFEFGVPLEQLNTIKEEMIKAEQEKKLLSEQHIDELVKLAEKSIDELQNCSKYDKNNITKRLKEEIIELENCIVQEAEKTEDIETLKKLLYKITPKILKSYNFGMTSRTKFFVQSKITRIQQKEAISKVRNQVPTQIVQIVTRLANGTLNVDEANKIIENEAKRRCAGMPQKGFASTEEQQKQQIVMQINMALKEKGQLYPIENAKATMQQLMQLGNINQIQAIDTIVKNFTSRKEYTTAGAICKAVESRFAGEEAKQIYRLKKHVKICELSDLANEMLKNKNREKEKEYYSQITTIMEKENIKPSEVPIEKDSKGITIYLDKKMKYDKER